MSQINTIELEKLSREVRRKLCRLYRACLRPDERDMRSDLPAYLIDDVAAVRAAIMAYAIAEPKINPVHRAAEGPGREP